MIATADPAEFALKNKSDCHRFLFWRGLTNTMDREDALQDFYQVCLSQPILSRAMACGDKYHSYVCATLQNVAINRIRAEAHDWTQGPATARWPSTDPSDATCSDGTSCVFNNIYITEFSDWLQTASEARRGPGTGRGHHASQNGARTALACFFRLKADRPGATSGPLYRTFQNWRNKYQEREVAK